MKILLVARLFPDSFGDNIAVAARRLGHTVRVIEDSPILRHRSRYWAGFWALVPKLVPEFEMRRHRALLRAAAEFDPDLILLTETSLPPHIIRNLRRANRAKVAFWYPDALVNLGRQYPLGCELDAWFFKDPYMVRMFRDKLGINAHYLPEACNPLWHRPVELTAEDIEKYGCDLTTASNMYYYRARMLEVFKDYDLKIWGKGYPPWLESPLRDKYTDVYVAKEAKAKAFGAAKIVLNTIHYGEIEGVNCRLFEVAGCGAFQIADRKPAMAELFEPEYEVVTFQTRRELKEKVDYYLSRPEERLRIAGRARARAHREHTYELRLQRMFEIVGLAAKPELAATRREDGGKPAGAVRRHPRPAAE